MRTVCSIEDCDRPEYGRGLCNMHWKRWRKHGDPLVIGKAGNPGQPRQWQRKVFVRRLVDYPAPTPQPTPCRLWQGVTRHNGYVEHGVRPDGKLIHRWVWEQINGPIPPGMCVLHKCDQGLCYRYDHLWLGTRADNNRDMAAKGRARNRSTKDTGDV